MSGPVSRLAPTPSGHLHLGNLLSFAWTWALVRREGGKLYLRMDDADEARGRAEFVDEIHELLRWLGFNWDAEFGQQGRKDVYRRWLDKFPRYACACSRKDVEARTGGNTYDGHCLRHPQPFVPGFHQWRLKSPVPADDVVLWRKDDLPAYHLASLVDDLEHGVDLVVRGEDLWESTRVQRLMASLLGTEGAPFVKARFIHHRLLLGPDGKKLSKSAGAFSLKALRDAGAGPRMVFQELSRAAQLPHEAESLRDFLSPEMAAALEG